MKTFKELAEEFGKKEIKIIVKDKISEWTEERRRIDKLENEWRRNEVIAQDNERWIFTMIIEELNEIKEIADKKINIWENRLRILNGGKDRAKNFDIDLIKQIPIGNLLENPVNETIDKVWYHCPLHDGDNTPSFIWNKKRNTYKCFSCGAGESDIINLYMELYGVSFREACKNLSKM